YRGGRWLAARQSRSQRRRLVFVGSLVASGCGSPYTSAIPPSFSTRISNSGRGRIAMRFTINKAAACAALFVALPALWVTRADPAADPAPKTAFVFRDVGNEAGLFPDLAGIAGHGVGWGDVDGSGYPSLYVGTFGCAPYGSKPNQFFRNVKGKFQLDDQKHL